MKKLFILIFLITISCFTGYSQKIVKNGNVFSIEKTQTKTNDVLTDFQYSIVDKNGNTQLYPIYITKNNACYIKRISSKTGKEYKQYLSKEICAEICKALGRNNL